MNFIETAEKKLKITKYGFPIIGSALLISLILLWAGLIFLFVPAALFTLFSLYFFRDPERTAPPGANIVISPADGRVLDTENLDKSPYDGEKCIKVSIFMSVFNVHVNRIPFSGTVKDIKYFPGKFLNASFDKASEDNERNAVLIETKNGIKFWTVQIAGLIARRIVTNIKTGDFVEKGSRYGMIKFGSRLELYVPTDSEINVSKGDTVKAGESIICKFNEQQS
jgi:phosphatidylserine decarboxylase